MLQGLLVAVGIKKIGAQLLFLSLIATFLGIAVIMMIAVGVESTSMLLTMVIVMTLFYVVAYLYARAHLLDQLQPLCSVLRAVAKGDLTQRLSMSQQEDEMGTLFSDYNDACMHFARILSSVVGSIEQLGGLVCNSKGLRLRMPMEWSSSTKMLS